MELELTGRVALITGAGSGIGLAAARALLAEGARVVGADLDPTALGELGDDGHVVPVLADMSDPGSADALARTAMERFGRIDVLFNNAGAAATRDGFLDTTDEQWHRTLELNLLGYVRAARAVIPHMLAQGRGTLLHNASEAGRMPNPRLPDYSVSKAGVRMLSKVLSREFTGRGIRSNVISPGFIRTPIYDRPGGLADSLATEFNLDREAALRRYVEINGIPAGRLGLAEEVAALVVLLASDRTAFVTGAEFAIEGGVTPTV
ncbi:SDR family NAD(P)-dependent oxidoreductase [Streptomyces carpaticus]|uniref:SDR family NAD(P)-dependent oxidoreductase n=1 Tax=Streptomyces carpaticus TaxID=285558 RepID=A0ABV4ZS25_9ACTN